MLYLDRDNIIVCSSTNCHSKIRDTKFLCDVLARLLALDVVVEADITTRAESDAFNASLGSSYAKFISATIKIIADNRRIPATYYLTFRDKQVKRNEAFPCMSSVELLMFNNGQAHSLFKIHCGGLSYNAFLDGVISFIKRKLEE